MKNKERITVIRDKKILIIEECQELREIISTLCSNWGANTISAHDSKDLVYQALNEKPDLIIFHPGNEKMTAHYTCKLLKSMNETRLIPILLTTGDYESIKSKELESTGYDDYILKPFGTKQLLKKIEHILQIDN